MKRIILIISVLVTLFTMLSCGERNKGVTLVEVSWPKGFYPWIDVGVSAPLCEVLNGQLIIAGGANFPTTPAVEGGTKRLHNHVFIQEGQSWTHTCKIPTPLAYGGSFVIDNNLYIIGGNNGNSPTADVNVLSRVNDWFEINRATSLPMAVEQFGYAFHNHTIYVAGGMTQDGGSRAAFAGKVNKAKIEWTTLPSLPEPLVQPIAFVADGRLYVWGGFNPESKEIFTTGWRLDEENAQWEPVGEPQDNAPFVGSSVVSLSDGRTVVIGGVDKEIFSWGLSATGDEKYRYMTMDPKAYKFNQNIRIYDPSTESWTIAGKTACLALAGAGLTCDGNSIYIIGGEIKPGVRTPKIWKLELK